VITDLHELERRRSARWRDRPDLDRGGAPPERALQRRGTSSNAQAPSTRLPSPKPYFA